MKATPLSPADIFGNQIRYVVPLFQRPYVWNEEDQWAPLWADVVSVAESVLDSPPPLYGPRVAPPHFLGAVVVEQEHTGVNYISTRGIVDGQQRMTTLQLLMDAAQTVVAAHGDPQDAQALEVLVLNPAQLSPHKDMRFKVWPTDRDQPAFRAAMDDDAPVPDDFKGSLIVKAHQYFSEQVREWAELPGDPDSTSKRLNALTIALRDFLRVVMIDLEPGDNAQVIFETLNHRGTALLAADLVKNLVFQKARALHLDIEALYREGWAGLDTDYWRAEVAQGRLYRPRIDVFLNYWLTMRLSRMVATDRIFVEFRDYLNSSKAPQVGALVAELVSDAKTFGALEKYPPNTVVGGFYYRVITVLDSAAVTPFVLWLLSKSEDECPPEQRHRALQAMESWLVRRALCRLTAKGVNQVLLELLKALEVSGPASAGEATERFLANQTADARLWPTDEHVVQSLTTQNVYRNLSRARLRMLLEALEDDIRTRNAKTEKETCPRNLTVEHVMPQAWESYWPLGSQDPLAQTHRDLAVQTLGNLTLVTAALNPSMSNAPWTDTEARRHGTTIGKRTALLQSVLRLNNTLVGHDVWTESDIRQRGEELALRATHVWPRPEPTPAQRLAPPPEPEASAQPHPTAAAKGTATVTLMSPRLAEAREVSGYGGKYAPLYWWLQERSQQQVHVSFSTLESILGFSLPGSCRNHVAHWHGYDGSAVARAIADAGWRASQVNLTDQTVTFIPVHERHALGFSRRPEDVSTVRDFLIATAERPEERFPTYSEVAATYRGIARGVGPVLNSIARDCASAGQPDLTALVVDGRTGLPGTFAGQQVLAGEASEIRWRAEVTRIRTHPWHQ